ncbi:MAG TPA: stage II sporulation protein M, partial [Polyangiaceae bacterium]
MTEDDFIASRRADWEELDRLLGNLPNLNRLSGAAISRVASLYRSLSTDLVRAHSAGYSAETIGYLDSLAARAHNLMYSAPPRRLGNALKLFTRDFPRALRRRAPFFVLSAMLFLLPG